VQYVNKNEMNTQKNTCVVIGKLSVMINSVDEYTEYFKKRCMHPTKNVLASVSHFFLCFDFSIITLAHEMVKNTLNFVSVLFNMF